jgi:regulatory protein
VERAARPVPEDPDDAAAAAYGHGLRLLSSRELAEADVRTRLAARGFDPAAVDAAVGRLRQAGALSNARAVRAVARTLVVVKRRGRLRAQRELEARGFGKAEIAEALAELFAGEDERALVDRALDRRLRGRPAARGDVAAMRRVYAALLRQGFPPAIVRDAVRRRFSGAVPDDEPGTP